MVASTFSLMLFYFLSGWGLGGAQPLAVAKANLSFASTVRTWLWNCLCLFLLRAFFEGVRGKLFFKKSSPAFSLLLSKILHNVVCILFRNARYSCNLFAGGFFQGGESAEGCEKLFGFGVADAGNFGKG